MLIQNDLQWFLVGKERGGENVMTGYWDIILALYLFILAYYLY